jgi:Ner family transcriptional regulator
MLKIAYFFLDMLKVACYLGSMDTNKNETNKQKSNPAVKPDNRVLREWVKFRLSLKGYTFKKLGEKHRITGVSICTVFYRPYPKVERIIADALETQPWDFWPERYDEKGRPNRRNLWYLRKYGLWHPKNTTAG